MSQARHPQLRDSGNGPKASIAKLFEQGTSINQYCQVKFSMLFL